MAELPLYGRRGAGKFALIDDEDLHRVNHLRWGLRKETKAGPKHRGYVFSRVRVAGRQRMILLHRVIMDAPQGSIVDHIDPTNTLDNRKSNLRFVTPQESMRNRPLFSNNTSGYRGVQLGCKSKRWVARLWVMGRNLYLGTYDTKEEAAAAYEDARARLGLLKATVD